NEAETQARSSRRESLPQQHQHLVMTSHNHGWADEAWDPIRQASRLQPHAGPDPVLQGYAVTTLSGLDARLTKRFTGFGAQFVVFDRVGRRLLMGPTTDPKDPSRTLGTKLWDDATQELTDLHFDGQGPVGFRPDGTPIQLAADSKAGTLALWDLAKRQVLQS